MKLIGETITDQNILERILQILPKKYDMLIKTILESKDLTTFLVEQLTRSLLAHETRQNLAEDSMEQDFKAQLSLGRGIGKGYGGCNERVIGRSKYHDVAGQWRPSQIKHKEEEYGRNLMPIVIIARDLCIMNKNVE